MHWLALILSLLWPLAVLAQEGVPGLDLAQSSVTQEDGDLLISLRFAAPVPYRPMLVTGPKRLVIDVKSAGDAQGELAGI